MPDSYVTGLDVEGLRGTRIGVIRESMDPNTDAESDDYRQVRAVIDRSITDLRSLGAVVVDPVVIAKSGDAVLEEDAVAALVADILPRADLLTPNLPEAARLLNQPEADSADQMVTQARALLKMGPKAVLMKGGHSAGNICSDALVTAERVTWLSAPRIDTRNTHGTGCTYAAAIAAGLAHGNPLGAAVQAAHDYLHRAIIAADQLEIGTGHGPVHHFHAVWS